MKPATIEMQTATLAIGGPPGAGDARASRRNGVSALLLREKGRAPLVLLSADVIWFPDAVAARLRQAIARLAVTDEARIILAASHTHGCPQPEPRFPFGRRDPKWVELLERTVLEAAAAATGASPLAVTLHHGRAMADPPVAINRRRMAWYRAGLRIGRRVQSLPNAGRAADHLVRVVVARDDENRVRHVLALAACHPVSLPADTMGADFPGVLRHELQRKYGSDVAVTFLQGHCGDIRPRLIRSPSSLKDHLLEAIIGPRFRASREGDAEAIGAGLADAAVRAIAGATPMHPDFAAARSRLPLTDVEGVDVDRGLDVTVWRFSPDLTLVASSGEMLSGLAHPDAGVLSVGYANGMVGYVAPACEYAGGGYEVDGFLQPFGLTRRFAVDTERRFAATRADLLARVAGGAAASDRASAA